MLLLTPTQTQMLEFVFFLSRFALCKGSRRLECWVKPTGLGFGSTKFSSKLNKAFGWEEKLQQATKKKKQSTCLKWAQRIQNKDSYEQHMEGYILANFEWSLVLLKQKKNLSDELWLSLSCSESFSSGKKIKLILQVGAVSRYTRLKLFKHHICSVKVISNSD